MHTRRHFLRSASSLIALPALESIGFKAFAAAKTAAPPKRMVFLSFGWGVTNETWFPDVKTTGEAWELSEGLKPLSQHQKDITVVQGCSNRFANEAHWGSTFWLTGANRYAEPGQSFHNSISADQVAAAHLGKDTRFASIQLNTPDAQNSGHGPSLSLAWDLRGKPVAGLLRFGTVAGDEGQTATDGFCSVHSPWTKPALAQLVKPALHPKPISGPLWPDLG